jgi:hypothetical protein
MTVAATEREVLERVDASEPIVHHLVIEDPIAALQWGVLPGTALCGFVFTTANAVSAVVASAEGGEDCTSCLRRDAQMFAEWCRAHLS